MKCVHFILQAEQEMLDAARYYALLAPSLGVDFLGKIESAASDIGEHPERWPVLRFEIRRRLVHRFPYALLYRVDSEEVVVLRPCICDGAQIIGSIDCSWHSTGSS